MGRNYETCFPGAGEKMEKENPCPVQVARGVF